MSDVRLPTARLAIAVLVCLAAHAFPSFIPSLKGGISSAKDAVNSSTPAEAVAVSTRYLSLHPADEKALSLRADAWWMMKRFNESARDARAILVLNPWNEHARDLLIADLEGLERWGEVLAEMARGKALQSLAGRLAEDIQNRRYDAAEARLSGHLNAYPRDVRALRLRASLRRMMRDFGPSAEDARAALAVAPWNRDSGLRWILIGDLISESRYWDAFKEIRTVQGQAEEEGEDMFRQVAVPSTDLAALFDRLSVDLAFREISHGTSVTTKQRWLWRLSEWFTILTSWTGVIAQILMIGVYCGRFSGKRLLPSGGDLSASALPDRS